MAISNEDLTTAVILLTKVTGKVIELNTRMADIVLPMADIPNEKRKQLQDVLNGLPIVLKQLEVVAHTLESFRTN